MLNILFVAAKMKRELARAVRAEEKSAIDEEEEPDSVESRFLREELGKELDEALRSIPLHHAVAAICHYGYAQPYAEVGDRLGKSADTARKYAARGIKELKEEDMIDELSRLLSGETITDAVRENAIEMKRMAKSKKTEVNP